ncbi:MAG: hypothetical protein COW03_11200 [Cytophagales bacterium CG12_big_fil_rev_8_21_14_0_65_40_12]|nr:MAG: hypothetical protein COW03_11200 [Cytophagales bacterium CG12_big_fil_rev_8_21_14_0_65_40_12]PIW03516.1 MAG: hypothetical protein COW40_14415 [Cytophagales bacterium CG17_big_fil_post_rev_8_21_14_2_50_40_13]
MVILVFKTSLMNRKQIQAISPSLNDHPSVLSWSVDLEDWERILRIEATNQSSAHEIAASIKALGFECEELNH